MENIDKQLELVTEEYLKQRLYSSRVPLSDGFSATLFKEFQRLRQEGYNVDRIIKKITFELKKMDSEKPKEEIKPVVKELDNTPKLPERAMKEVVKTVDRGI
jgi:hypothetical protein